MYAPKKLRPKLGPLWAGALAIGATVWACGTPFSTCEETLSCADDSLGGQGGQDGTGGATNSGGLGNGGQSACAETCNGDTSVCNPDSGDCVGCLAGTCGSGVCNTENDVFECVECVDHGDCSDPTKPICSGHECVACGSIDEGTDDCNELDLNVCMPDGSCVECTSENECGAVNDIGGNVCDPQTHKCTDVGVHSVDICGKCAHDLDCKDKQVCVQQTFDGVEVGSYCTWRKDGRPVTVSASCASGGRPFARQLTATTTVDGATADVCVLRTTTCPAFLQHSQAVNGCVDPDTDDDACGIADTADGLCRYADASVDAFCTYPCGSDADCKATFACTAQGYCAL